MNKKSILIIGAGNMGGAIARSLSREDKYSVFVFDKNPEAAKSIEKATAISNLLEENCYDALIIAVKPQILPSLYEEISKIDTKLIISIAAGVSLKTLEEKISPKCPIVRFMPNIAARTRNAVTAIAYPEKIDNESKEMALSVASSFGSAFELDEKLFPAFIGISGSAIAYSFEFMHQIAMGGVREGIPYSKAIDIARDTMLSAISLQKETGANAIELETMVCSAGGTTIEGIKALDDGAFASTVINAVSAAAEKSRELEEKA